jgi:hypothetical protein
MKSSKKSEEEGIDQTPPLSPADTHQRERCDLCKFGFPVMDLRYRVAYIVCERNPVRIVKHPNDHCGEFWAIHTPPHNRKKS